MASLGHNELMINQEKKTCANLKCLSLISGAMSHIRSISVFDRKVGWDVFNQLIELFLHIDGLVQDCTNSNALEMELLQSRTKLSI